MNKKFYNLYLFLFSISLIYFLLFAAFYLTCFLNKNGLYKLIIDNETYKNLPFTLSDFDLKNLSNELMKYISGHMQFLETKVTIDGVLTDFYSLRSKIHMADVRNIISVFKNVCFASIAICIFSMFKINTYNLSISDIKKSYIKTLIIVAILLIVIIVYASVDFDAFFIKFHETLFDNDLWLLDPSEDYIICLLPEKIFMIYAARIAISMIISLILPFLCLQLLSKTQPHQEAK